MSRYQFYGVTLAYIINLINQTGNVRRINTTKKISIQLGL